MVDERLRSALDGVKLTEREERYLEWLSRMDGETVEVFSGLFETILKSERERLLKWLDSRIEECRGMGLTTVVALNAEIATLIDVRNFVDGLTLSEKTKSAPREEGRLTV